MSHPLPAMALLLAVLLSQLGSVVMVVTAQCAAPLTVMLAAQNQWTAWIAETNYAGPLYGDSLIAPYSSVDRVMNITVNVQRSIVAIGVLVTSAGDPRSSLIASVSYNGVKLATTGGEVSLWTYTTDESYISDTWWTSGYDDSLWTLSDTTAQCNADTAPVTNRDGMSYSQLISANGIAPEYDSPQYGGTTARWIGLNGNSGICTSTSTVAYRIVLDLNTLAAEPTCYPAEDGRSFLSLGNPMMRFPSIGPRTKTSRVVSFVGGADNELAIWADGMGALGPREPTSTVPSGWCRISQMDFNVEPKTNNLVAIHVANFGGGRNLAANILYEGQVFTASDSLAPWKIFAGDSNNQPAAGWNTDPNFDDTTWSDMSDTVACVAYDGISQVTNYLNKTYGACADWFWHNSGCDDNGVSQELFVRIYMNLRNFDSRPALVCPAPWTHVLTEDPDDPTDPPADTLSEMEIIAIASSATIGCLMMVAAYISVRHYRAKKAQNKALTSTESPSGVNSDPKTTQSFISGWSLQLPKAKPKPSKILLADISSIQSSNQFRVMGEMETMTMASTTYHGSTSSPAAPYTIQDVTMLTELVEAYQKKRSFGFDVHSSQQGVANRTRTRVLTTTTDHTLVDGTKLGLEIPGFLQLKEGIDYNLDEEFALGGGGSLYRGRMFAFGLPNLNVIVKKMTNASLPAFRQEVALMWLFNDCEYMVKLMGFNEMQLAIVMPEYSIGSLKRFIDSQTYDCKVTRSILLDVMRGLSAMHGRGVVHQDIKAENILLELHPVKRVHAVLTDFGISNVVDDSVLTVRAFEVKNMRGLTVRYAPPEAILRFRNKDLSRVPPLVAKAGDVYSLAIVVHALLENTSLS